ncbi:MAG: hypothetical protein RL318_155 [Fibrobacterota bacterium]|jgi:hypothetical protein
MNLPKILTGRPTEPALDILQATSINILGTLQGEGLISETQLGYGYEDLPLMDELAGLIAGAARFWHGEFQIATDFAVLSRGFVHAFLMGLETASQIHRADADGIHLETSLAGIFDGKRRATVSEPLSQAGVDVVAGLENTFVTFQDQILVPTASTHNQDLFYDFYACGCLWAALAGVDAGLARLEEA